MDHHRAAAGHMMWKSFAVSDTQAGMGEISIASLTRHASLGSLKRYVRGGALFSENLATEIGL